MNEGMLQVYKVHKPEGCRDGKLELIAVKHNVHGLSSWHDIAQQVLHHHHLPFYVMAWHGMSCYETVVNKFQIRVLHHIVSINSKLLPDL